MRFTLLEAKAEAAPDEDNEKLKQLEVMKPLLSVETVNVLLLLGFNFRRAIGEPLTALMEGMILSRSTGLRNCSSNRCATRELWLSSPVIRMQMSVFGLWGSWVNLL